MKKNILLLAAAGILLGSVAEAQRPTVILGPGLNSGRTIYVQNFNRTLTKDTIYILTGLYSVDSTRTITIQAGTLIKADTAACLIVKRGAQIFATGTVEQPIVFTSNKPAGSRNGGDWGGIVILGAAPCNQNNPLVEGGILPGSYGGPLGAGSGNPNDNSGTFRYVRIEFPGYRFQLNNEVNGLTMGGVGRGTTIEYVQVSYSYDDAFEWFGGTVDAKYLVAVGGIDDEFDTDFGYQGRVQFAFGLKDPNVFEFAGGQTNGFESDNEGTASYKEPRTLPRFSNISLVGPRRSDAVTLPVGHRFEYSAVIRRGSQLSLYNSIIMGFPGGYSLRDAQSMTSAQGDTLQVRNVSLQADGPLLPVHSSGTPPLGFVAATWFNTAAYNNIGGTATRLPSAIGLVDMSTMTNPDPRPGAGSEPATAGVEFTNLNALASGYFTPTTYRGAFDPALPLSQQWIAGWTEFDPQNYNPEQNVVSVPVGNSWNIVSLPVSGPVPNDSVLNIYTNSTNPYGFAFAGAYVQSHTMTPGLGYWIKSSTAYTQNILGTPLFSLNVNVAAGWNMIGSIFKSIDTSSAHVTPSPSNVRGSNYFRYSNGYLVAETIEPGLGYWVKANSSGSFLMHVNAAPQRSGHPGVGFAKTMNDLNSITIQDANGGSQTLYFGADSKGEIPVAMFAMPPSPPVGSFDARFASADGGTMVQTHAEEVSEVLDLPITLQSSDYPLTISWNVGAGMYELNDGATSHPMRGEGTVKITNNAIEMITLKVSGGSLPKEFALSQNYPNPFNPTTSVKYALPVDSRVTMEIYNVIGQRVRTLVNDNLEAGYHAAEWNGKNNAGQQLASGMYFLQLSVRGNNGKAFSEVRKLMMLK